MNAEGATGFEYEKMAIEIRCREGCSRLGYNIVWVYAPGTIIFCWKHNYVEVRFGTNYERQRTFRVSDRITVCKCISIE